MRRRSEIESLDRGARRVAARDFSRGARPTSNPTRCSRPARALPLRLEKRGARSESQPAQALVDDIAIVTAGMRAKFDVVDNVPTVAEIAPSGSEA